MIIFRETSTKMQINGNLSHSRSVSLPIRSSSLILLVFKVKTISIVCNVHLYPFLG